MPEEEEAEKSQKEIENLELCMSPTWGAAPVEPISTKISNNFYPTDVIILSKFGIDWYSGFGSGEVLSLPSPIGTQTRPYHMKPCRACS